MKNKKQKIDWQRDPNSLNDYLISVWNKDRAQVMSMGRRQAQEWVRRGWARVLCPYAIVMIDSKEV